MKRNARNEILAGLVRRGYSFRSWAVDKGYKPRTVSQVVTRVSDGAKVRGALTLRIIADLEKTIGKTIFKH